MILRGDSDKYEYLGENETKFETILTHWSVVKAGSKMKKTRGRKSGWTVPIQQINILVFTLPLIQKNEIQS